MSTNNIIILFYFCYSMCGGLRLDNCHSTPLHVAEVSKCPTQSEYYSLKNIKEFFVA